MAKKRYTFVLSFGYAENQHLGYMPWTSENTYKDAKEAILDLASYLKEQYYINVNYAVALKKCCHATKLKDSEAKFCTKCGSDITKDRHKFDGEHFCQWLRELNTCIDSFHGLIEWDPEHRWKSETLEGAPNQRFVYQAEWVLAAALGYNYQNQRTFEQICQNRTKSRKESFTYY